MCKVYWLPSSVTVLNIDTYKSILSFGGRKGGTKVERQTVLVSATMPSAVLRAAAVWGHRPLLVRATSIIEVENYKPGPSSSNGESPKEAAASISPDLQGARESMPPNLEHFYVIAPVRHHVDILRKCIHALEAKSVIVFLNHSRRLKDVEFKLQARGLSAGTYRTWLCKSISKLHTFFIKFKSGYQYM